MLACNLVWEQRIIGQREKCMIRGGWLGCPVSNQVHQPLLYGWVGKGELVPFPAALNHAAQITTINTLYLSHEWRGQSDLLDIHAVYANRALLPSKP